MNRIAGSLVIAALAVAVAACSGANAADPTSTSAAAAATPGAPGDASTVRVDAKDIAFTETSVAATADRPFQIRFTNNDTAPHNITIVGPDGNPVFTGDVVSGPGSTTYAVPALKAGTYQFRCDIHPNMTGSLVVR